MAKQMTILSLHASHMALLIWRMYLKANAPRFSELREEANEVLDKMKVKVTIPATRPEFLNQFQIIFLSIEERLRYERQRLGGDIEGLPLFLLQFSTLNVAIIAPFSGEWNEQRQMISDCLKDLELDSSLIHHFETELGWIRAKNDVSSGKESVDIFEALRPAASFNYRVIETLLENSMPSESEQLNILREISKDIKEHRQEFRRGTARLEQLIVKKDEKVIVSIKELQGQLASAGFSKEKTVEITDKDPKSFIERLLRWEADGVWADPAEKALWAALDFVPLGTTVKLGLKVLNAFRSSMKGK